VELQPAVHWDTVESYERLVAWRERWAPAEPPELALANVRIASLDHRFRPRVLEHPP